MALIIEQPRPEPIDPARAIATAQLLADVPGLMADRIGQLYAQEERLDRLARTERLIREAQAQA